MLVGGKRVLDPRGLSMRVLGMRVFAPPVPGVRFLGRRVPGNSQLPGNRLRRTGGPVLIAAAALLVVAAGSPSAGGASRGRAPAPSLAVLEPPRPGSPAGVVPGGGSAPALAPLHRVLPADLLVVSATPLPAGAAAKIGKLPGVRAAEQVEAARVRVNGSLAAVLGVDPSAFRRFAAKPTALDSALWRSVAGGAIAVSYTMGRQAKLPAGSLVTVAGTKLETLRVGGLGTVGIAGVDAVVSDAVARSLGFPAGNAIVISAPGASLPALKSKIKTAVPKTAVVELLVAPAIRATGGSGTGGSSAAPGSSATGGLLSPAQLSVFLRAAVSRVGMPYVWGAAGPAAFDCSGLVQWSLARAGVAMPRVAADQARTGPAVPVSRLQPGDLLFYHTDPTAPGYISHVAIYLGKGLMIQAPEPGMDVQIVPVDLGSGFAGAVAVAPAVAAAAAANPVG
jgi:peptidoglycan DL-endopeptidase CwlO